MLLELSKARNRRISPVAGLLASCHRSAVRSSILRFVLLSAFLSRWTGLYARVWNTRALHDCFTAIREALDEISDGILMPFVDNVLVFAISG